MAQWHRLVNDAQFVIADRLDEVLESYLVFLLMRYMRHHRLGARIMALDYLEGTNSRSRSGKNRLREVGDSCLLFAGLFPEIARRRRVAIHYFIELGQTAYATLSDNHSIHGEAGSTFTQLAEGFVRLVDVLLAMRTLNGQGVSLQPLEAYELWNETGSRFAYQALSEQLGSPPIGSDKIPKA